MKLKIFSRKQTYTQYIRLDTRKCKACWECISGCPNGVLGKIDLPWHKHALVLQPAACSGCFNCMNVCPENAYSSNENITRKEGQKRNSALNNFLVNSLLAVLGLVMIISGMVLQVGFHMGGAAHHISNTAELHQTRMNYEEIRKIDPVKTVFGYNYDTWSDIHKSVIVVFSFLIAYHTYVHWKWFRGVYAKRLFRKNKQVIILTFLFTTAAVTGIVPWIIDLAGGSELRRMMFIEIHDKLTLLLIVFLVLHFIQRAGWYLSALRKIDRKPA